MEKGFPDSSVGKESACNAGDPGLIPGSGRRTGERIGYPLQYSWASFVAQLVKNLPAKLKTSVQFLGRKLCWRMDKLPTLAFFGFPRGSAGEESTFNVGCQGLIPGLVRSPGVMKGYPLQYSALENSMDCLVHGVTNRRTGLSNFHFQLLGLVICYLPLTASISVSPTPWH